MNKVMLAAALVVLTAGVAMAQYGPGQVGGPGSVGTPAVVGSQGGTVGGTYTGNVQGVLNYIPNYDVMGAHENGGRGCAGCHAPHNGAKGSGGNTIGVTGYGAQASNQGGLWGTDTSAIMSFLLAGPVTFNGGLSHASGVLTMNGTNNWSDPNYTGIATCLSCHDGAVSQGAMMSGQSYEQLFGLLNQVGIGINTNRGVNGAGLTGLIYGPNPIPTLLGGGTGLGYAYQHPIGQTANMSAVLGTVLTSANYGLAQAISVTGVLNIAAVVPRISVWQLRLQLLSRRSCFHGFAGDWQLRRQLCDLHHLPQPAQHGCVRRRTAQRACAGGRNAGSNHLLRQRRL